MSFRTDMLDTIGGRPTRRIPYVPRLDLWYRSNQLAGTMPGGLENATCAQVAASLRAGVHAIVPNFKDLRRADDELDRGLGVYNLWCMPVITVFENVQRSVTAQPDRTRVEYRTPHGTISTVVRFDETMKKAGITISHIEEHAFKGRDDYAALGYLFENASVHTQYQGYREYADVAGDEGLAAAFVSLAASPMHLIQRELMPLDKFFFEQFDHPDELGELARKIGGYWSRLLAAATGCPAELFLLGANYDARVTYPPFFQEHIQPWLRQFADDLHAQGRYLLTHTDGENSGLLEHYVQCGFDVADSVCPSPMTQVTMRQARQAFEGHGITIMGGIPSVALLEGTMSDSLFEAFLDGFFEDIGRGDRLILGISDTTPPAASFRRLQIIADRVERFGPVGR